MTDEKTVWIIARDGRRARLLASAPDRAGLRHAGTLQSDNVETAFAPPGPGRIRTRERERFAEIIAGTINRHTSEGGQGTVTVVAPPCLAMTIRAVLSDEARRRLVMRTGAPRINSAGGGSV
jgi:protein required for attachment to host cells